MKSIEKVPAQDACFEIIDTVASLENTSITNLPPLYDVIDPDNLNSLLESEGVKIEFSYMGYQITVTSDGVQSVTENP